MTRRWRHTVELGDLLGEAGEAMPFPERRDAIVARIREARLPFDPNDDDDLEWILDDMAAAPDEKAPRPPPP